MLFRRPPARATKVGATVPIKRVLRRGALFTCGVCRKDHAHEAYAEACLAACLDRWLGSTAVVGTDGSAPGEAKRFRCGICRRVYTVRAEAQSCSNACKAKTAQAVEAEREVFAPAPTPPDSDGASSSSASIPATEKRRPRPKPVDRKDQMHKFLRDGRTLVCRKCGKEYQTLDDVIACYDADVLRNEAAKTAAADAANAAKHAPPQPKPAPAPKVVAPPPAGSPQDDKQQATDHGDDHKFVRDNAKYKCRKCSAKFFTKADVVACHDAH